MQKIWTTNMDSTFFNFNSFFTDLRHRHESNNRCECQLVKTKFVCFLWWIHGMEIVHRLVQRNCDWQNETDEEPIATALEIFSDWRRGPTTTFHKDYRWHFWQSHWRSGEVIRQRRFYFAIKFAQNLQAAFDDNRKLRRYQTLMETTEKHRLILLKHGQLVNQQCIFLPTFWRNDFLLKHGKLGKFLRQEENFSVTNSSKLLE